MQFVIIINVHWANYGLHPILLFSVLGFSLPILSHTLVWTPFLIFSICRNFWFFSEFPGSIELSIGCINEMLTI